jgi:hypothetical protein
MTDELTSGQHKSQSTESCQERPDDLRQDQTHKFPSKAYLE